MAAYCCKYSGDRLGIFLHYFDVLVAHFLQGDLNCVVYFFRLM